jgi:MFS family permease
MSDRYGRRRMIALFVMLTAVPTVWLALTMRTAGHIMPVDPSQVGIVTDAHLVSTFWGLCISYGFLQGLTYGSSSALFMDITTPAVAATQFTAYMALGNLATSYTATWQGVAVVDFGYPTTLLLDVAIGMLCIGLLPWLEPARQSPKVAPMAVTAA